MVKRTLLRRRDGRRAEVTSVELFFDLVFVIAVTQISHALLEHLSWSGALEAALLLAAIWWAWIDTAWITNWLDPARLPVRLMLFVLMAIGLVITSSLPEAFTERGLSFALAFAVFQMGRTLFALWAMRHDRGLFVNFERITIWYAVSALLWIVGGLVDGDARLVVWLVALAIDTAGPALGFAVPGLGRADTRDWTVDGGHMAERSGLFVLIALGESVLATGIGFTELAWTPEIVLAMGASLLQAIAIWSIFFGEHAERASHAIAHSSDPGRLARVAYTYVPILIVAGIIVTAVGDELTLAHPTGHTDWSTALVLVGGPALFLLGAALFKLAVFGLWPWPRLVGLAGFLILLSLATALSPLLLSIATTLILVAVGLYEMLLLRRISSAAEAVPIAVDDEVR
jgi:low temperature requirement protein LtrA